MTSIPTGGRIAGLRLPSMVVMEDGYAVGELGFNTVNFIEAIAQGWIAGVLTHAIDGRVESLKHPPKFADLEVVVV